MKLDLKGMKQWGASVICDAHTLYTIIAMIWLNKFCSNKINRNSTDVVNNTCFLICSVVYT